ncbi:hypothetical protein [Halalkalicoccus subterraneus]|uniref:hypothetical protein n=1 Tax=Halalkalicoccus subterraneus TaxID=2675002 RepID=UPI000EFC02E0|nr:hypothetical protein [Halalkalicoccus subterraneus]
MTINVQSLGSNTRSTARIHRAGAAAIAGAVALAASLIGHGVADYLGTDSMIDTPGTLAYYLSYGSLSVAWGLLFLGSLGFAAVALRSGRQLLKDGAALVSIGLAGTTLGFGFATAAGLAGLGEVALMGDTVAGLSMMFVFTLGSLVAGIALLRAEIASRMVAWLMIATGPAMLVGAMVVPAGLDVVLFAGPLCAAWILLGRELLGANVAIEESAAIPA